MCFESEYMNQSRVESPSNATSWFLQDDFQFRDTTSSELFEFNEFYDQRSNNIELPWLSSGDENDEDASSIICDPHLLSATSGQASSAIVMPLALRLAQPPAADTLQATQVVPCPCPAAASSRRGAHARGRPEMQQRARDGAAHWASRLREIRAVWEQRRSAGDLSDVFVAQQAYSHSENLMN